MCKMLVKTKCSESQNHFIHNKILKNVYNNFSKTCTNQNLFAVATSEQSSTGANKCINPSIIVSEYRLK